MANISVNLQPLISNLNLPTVIKTAILPNEGQERLFVATQLGEIFYLGDGLVELFLDISDRVIELGRQTGGYDERGLLGLAFHPDFQYNGLFYIHYSLAGSQGPGALEGSYRPNPCNLASQSLTWDDRENRYDHIDTVEEWVFENNGGPPSKRRTLLNLRRPFMNHNGVNSLHFCPETGKLILTTGDGGSAYDPFNLSQNLMEIAGKIIEIDVDMEIGFEEPPIVSRFEEIPSTTREALTLIGRGLRNTTGVIHHFDSGTYIKCLGQVGQDLVESIYSYTYYTTVPVPMLFEEGFADFDLEDQGFINLGWRGWEGDLPATIISPCSESDSFMNNQKILAYYNETIELSAKRMYPVVSYFHQDPRPDKFQGTAITGVSPYMGNQIPELTNTIVFCDFAKSFSRGPTRGSLGYTFVRPDCHPNDFFEIVPAFDFKAQPAYYVSLGSNMDQTRIFLGVYGSPNVTDPNLGTIFELVP